MEISTESSTGNVNIKPLGARNWELMMEFQLDFRVAQIFYRNLKNFSSNGSQLRVNNRQKLENRRFQNRRLS
jgi:hypothetical protein